MTVEIVTALFVFLAVTAAVLAVLGSAPASRVAEQRLETWRLPPPREGPEAGDVLRRGASALPLLRSLLSHGTWSQRAAMDLQQAGLRLKVSEYLLLRLLVATVTGLLVVLAIRGGAAGIFFALLFAAVGFVLPALYVRLRKERRAAAISRQLVEMIELISNALRSGFASVRPSR